MYEITEKPKYLGPNTDLIKFIFETLEVEADIENTKVVLCFIIDTTGHVVQLKNISKVKNDRLFEHISKLIKATKWIPGKIANYSVNTIYRIPIHIDIY